MTKRILVLSASVGGGHLRAAQAVELALRELDPEATVRNVDVLEFTNAVFRRVYGKAYLDLVNRAPHVLGYFYDLMDRPPLPGTRADRLRFLVERLNLGRFLKFLREEPWDVIVNTHFLPAEMVAGLRLRGELSTPQFTATTDFETHRLWVNQPCELYFTATEEGAAYLQHWGVPAHATRVTGIPIHPVFSRARDRSECITGLGLRGDRPIVLQLAGGFGVGPVENLFQSLLAIETPIELVVVAGRNAELKAQLEQFPVPERHLKRIFGFTERMDELLAAADLVVTKPGGLTTSESLVRGAALAIVNPIPGQESRNCDYLLENGAAVKINNVGTLAWKLQKLLAGGAHLSQLKSNARRLGRPRAAFEIAQAALDWGAGTVSRTIAGTH